MCSKFLALIKLQSMCCIHSAMFHIKKRVWYHVLQNMYMILTQVKKLTAVQGDPRNKTIFEHWLTS